MCYFTPLTLLFVHFKTAIATSGRKQRHKTMSTRKRKWNIIFFAIQGKVGNKTGHKMHGWMVVLWALKTLSPRFMSVVKATRIFFHSLRLTYRLRFAQLWCHREWLTCRNLFHLTILQEAWRGVATNSLRQTCIVIAKYAIASTLTVAHYFVITFPVEVILLQKRIIYISATCCDTCIIEWVEHDAYC